MRGKPLVVDGKFTTSYKLTWSRFRKRPVVVSATQMHVPFAVETLEGWSQGAAGDWLIEGVLGELYPCNEAVFRATYEPMEETDEDLLKSA